MAGEKQNQREAQVIPILPRNQILKAKAKHKPELCVKESLTEKWWFNKCMSIVGDHNFFLKSVGMHLLEQQKGDFSPRSPRFSFKKNGSLTSSSLPFLIIESLSRRSFSYDKIPEEPLNLTVIKLDGTSFQIELDKAGTVAQLKRAVETVFSHLPKSGPTKVSWSFVWSHFCLCYDGQKLLTDTDDIGSYGIKDGDKLHFIRHDSISYSTGKERSEEEDQDSNEPPKSEASDDKHLKSQEVDKCQRDIENQQDGHVPDEDLSPVSRRKWVNLFRGWFPYHKLPTSDVELDEHSNSFKFSFSSLGSFKALIYSGKYDFERETLTAE